jgi:HEAT repeat protein
VTLANVLVAVAIVLALAVAVICLAIHQTIRNFLKSPPTVETGTAQDAAKELAQNCKWGFMAIDKAVDYGDDLLPFLQEETEDYEELNGLNAPWIAEVLGRIRTENAQDTLRALYSSKMPLARFTGAAGLARQGILPDPIDEDHFLVQAICNASGTWADQDEVDLAVIALGYAKDEAALPYLFGVLQREQAYACDAIGRIGSESAIPVLKDCLRSFQFHALPHAFRALIALGDKEAVPLAIARITGSNSGSLVQELKNVTGVSFEYNRHLWQRWWDFAGSSWQIPDRFRSIDSR